MTFALAPAALAESYRLEAHDTIGSTNARALELARAGDPGDIWVVAGRQESGRGRRGRPWQTPAGNLAATLLVVLDGSLGQAAALGFVAGLTLSEALDAVVPSNRISLVCDGGDGGRTRFELKWPNDVVAGGAKLAGILLESTALGGGRHAVAVGLGVNVRHHPDDVPYPATSLAALGSPAEARDLFLALSHAWVGNSRLWRRGEGLGDIRLRWLERAAGLGREVAVRLDGGVVRGIFETIDEDGRFVIRDRGGERISIAAGDVHFGAVASLGAA